MKKVRLLILSLAFAAFAAAPVFAPATVSAANAATKACTGAATRSAFCHSSGGNPLTGSDGVIVKAAHIVAIVGGIAAVIVIIIAGISYVTSNGDAAQVAGAKRTIIYASVGLVVIGLAQAIVTFIVSKI